MYCKDVVTELVESIMNKKSKVCQDCHVPLKKQGVISHYIDVATSKVISSIVGGAVPAPDYRFTCPKCKSVYLLYEGKFVKCPKGTKWIG